MTGPPAETRRAELPFRFYARLGTVESGASGEGLEEAALAFIGQTTATARHLLALLYRRRAAVQREIERVQHLLELRRGPAEPRP